MILKLLGLLVFFLIVFVLLFVIYRHYITQNSKTSYEFLAGQIPSELPDGLHQGKVNLKDTTWLGKKFLRAEHRGINVFKSGESTSDVYPFKTYVAAGNVDPSLQVIKIDYNLPENPLWLRVILDEIVQTSPGHYLGKLIVRVLPGVSVALGYFELDQPLQL